MYLEQFSLKAAILSNFYLVAIATTPHNFFPNGALFLFTTFYESASGIKEIIFDVRFPKQKNRRAIFRIEDRARLTSERIVLFTATVHPHSFLEKFPETVVPNMRVCDEAHFWLNGYVNKQNCRIWSEANPQVYVETPLHPEKLTVWGALWAGGILLQKR
ncbi:hypothetical protein TNCV_3492241 [Trichonephila clavipes]|nr:hypothetical protein TNCV_3492241 [Trichonephila clavipes]